MINVPNNSENCIIVGNGTSVLDAELGDKIDSFDNVVRFNTYRIAEYEKNVGTKTDIWATCTADGRHLKEINSWAYSNQLCNWYYGRLTVTPNENLVKNFGFSHVVLK